MTDAARSPERLVVFDRDGTLVDFHRDEELGVVTPAFHPSHVHFLPGAIEGARLLSAAGYAVGIATNQPGPAKGQISRDAVARVNRAIEERLARAGVPVAAFETCLHHPEGGEGGDGDLVMACACRKPAPGMLLAIASRLEVSPSRAWMIGDTDVDVRAAHAAGFRAGLVHRDGRCEICPLPRALPGAASFKPDVQGPDLGVLARAILAHDTAAG